MVAKSSSYNALGSAKRIVGRVCEESNPSESNLIPETNNPIKYTMAN